MLEFLLYGSIQILQYYTNFFAVSTFHIVNSKITELYHGFQNFSEMNQRPSNVNNFF